eukprot:GEZU01002714.1.p1 GENE.GEZU01002714.1~~GEZU01002714.1.p1  ORF type:complete len:136 (+),score=25.64 GEZU01002714.1:84-491(+)
MVAPPRSLIIYSWGVWRILRIWVCIQSTTLHSHSYLDDDQSYSLCLSSTEKLLSFNIGTIVQVGCFNKDKIFLDHFRYHQIEIIDSPFQNIRQHFEIVFDLIDSTLNGNNGVENNSNNSNTTIQQQQQQQRKKKR